MACQMGNPFFEFAEAKNIEPTGDPEVFRCPVSGLEPLEAPGVGVLSFFFRAPFLALGLKGHIFFSGGSPRTRHSVD